jgi:hypothetical protein
VASVYVILKHFFYNSNQFTIARASRDFSAGIAFGRPCNSARIANPHFKTTQPTQEGKQTRTNRAASAALLCAVCSYGHVRVPPGRAAQKMAKLGCHILVCMILRFSDALESNAADPFFSPRNAASHVAFDSSATVWAEHCLFECKHPCRESDVDLDIFQRLLQWTREEDCDYR